jgi:hypothetical protein
MKHRPARAEYWRRQRRCLLPAAGLALAPKCLLCVPGYTGLGTVLGLGGPKLCGAPGVTPPWVTGLGLPGLLVGLTWLLARRTARTSPPPDR